MKKFLLLGFALFAAIVAGAQHYRQAVGIRGGLSSGFEYRAFSEKFVSYKALLSTRHRGIQFTGLKEFHQPGLFDFSDELVFVYGFGAHVGFEKWNAYDPVDEEYRPHYFETRTGFVAGLDGLAGLEYHLREAPLTFGLEVKPYFNLFGKNFFQVQPFDFAFTFKYNF